MPFGTQRPVIYGGAVVAYGRRYDLNTVLTAYAKFFDVLTTRLTKGHSAVERFGRLRQPFPWPVPGKEKAFAEWRRFAKTFEAVEVSADHHFPIPMRVTAKAFMLGKEWATYDRDAGLRAMPGSREVRAFDPEPCIELFAEQEKGGPRLGFDARIEGVLRRVVTMDLAALTLSYETEITDFVPGERRFVATVRFPYATYGMGEEWIRVRCVSPDLREISFPGEWL